MRLNRVLLLAATINLMIFAMVFTISCSGDDGRDGKDGCTIKSNDSQGYDVVCGDEVIGELANGKNGTNGAPGAQGTAGAGCTVNTASKTIICGATQYPLNDLCFIENRTEDKIPKIYIVCGNTEADVTEISTEIVVKFCYTVSNAKISEITQNSCTGNLNWAETTPALGTCTESDTEEDDCNNTWAKVSEASGTCNLGNVSVQITKNICSGNVSWK